MKFHSETSLNLSSVPLINFSSKASVDIFLSKVQSKRNIDWSGNWT